MSEKFFHEIEKYCIDTMKMDARWRDFTFFIEEIGKHYKARAIYGHPGDKNPAAEAIKEALPQFKEYHNYLEEKIKGYFFYKITEIIFQKIINDFLGENAFEI